MTAVDITQVGNSPTVLYQQHEHALYWLGINEPTAFRTNCYLLRDGEPTFLFDPGNRSYFSQVRSRVAQIMPPEQVTDIIATHQDPDVIASLGDWLEINPALRVHTSPRTQVLLPYYGRSDYTYIDNEQTPELRLPSADELRFIPTPFLHSSGAFAVYDTAAQFLFSSDIFASLEVGTQLWADAFSDLCANMRLFHSEYMASNIAIRGFTRQLEDLQIDAILLQHGRLIGLEYVTAAIDWLNQLPCGADLLYPDL